MSSASLIQVVPNPCNGLVLMPMFGCCYTRYQDSRTRYRLIRWWAYIARDGIYIYRLPSLTLLMSNIKYLSWLSRGVEFPADVSRVLEQRETKFRRPTPCFWGKRFNGAIADSVGRTVQPEIQDGGSKTEVPISRAVFRTKYKFQRLLSYFLAPLMLWHMEWNLMDYRRPLNPTWWPINRK
jgi:hypothetical protein